MEDVLIIRNYVNGNDLDPVFISKNPILITDFTYTSNRMGENSLSASFMYQKCLDNDWDGNQYVKFRGENYFIEKIPSSSKNNDDDRYKHDVVFVSERSKLKHVYFFDVVSDDPEIKDKYVSNSTNVVFMGTLSEFVERINRSLAYSKLNYNVVVDEDITTEPKLVSFEDKYIFDVLQESYNIYDVPFYFDGTTIHFGYTNNSITQPFRYGYDNQLLNISKSNANYKIVNRITAVGSEDNLPHYYPNPSDDRAAIEEGGGKWITPCANLMPPIYRESKGADRFYNAVNETYPIPDSDPLSYYYFENEYKSSNPKEFKIDFPDIKPTIKGILNATKQRIDTILDVAFDQNDNDEVDENNEYKHPYFYVKLNKFNGDFGFNLFDQAIAKQEMKISITSGICAACTFTIGVDEELQKNIVQVDENGDLKRDKSGNVIRSGKPQDRQNDTVNYNVWIALKKDIETFGVIMPNAEFDYKPSANDTFVILGINLPQAYITNAEDRLKQEMIKYMAENNSDKFNFTIDFSRIYLANNPKIANQINENSKILLEYDNETYPLYVSTYEYRKESDEILPYIRVELSETITVVRSQLDNVIGEVKDDILNQINNIDILKLGLKYFLRKDVTDIAREIIKFEKGAVFGRNFIDGIAGTGGKIDGYGNAWLRGLKLYDFLEVPELRYNRIQINDGEIWNASGGGIIRDVDERSKKAYLKLEKGELSSVMFDDICKGIYHYDTGFSTAYFKITQVGSDDNGSFFTYELKPSTTKHPTKFMNFVCYGNFTNKSRQKSSYQTREYTRYLSNVNNWDITSENIMMQMGDLSGLSIEGEDMSGYSAYLNNVYFSGFIKQLEALKNVNPNSNIRGLFNLEAEYVGNEFQCDVVYVLDQITSGNKTYYKAKIDAGVFSGVEVSDTSKWQLIGNRFDATSSNLILAETAYIGNLTSKGIVVGSEEEGATDGWKLDNSTIESRNRDLSDEPYTKLGTDGKIKAVEMTTVDMKLSGDIKGNNFEINDEYARFKELRTASIVIDTGFINGGNVGIWDVTEEGLSSNASADDIIEPLVIKTKNILSNIVGNNLNPSGTVSISSVSFNSVTIPSEKEHYNVRFPSVTLKGQNNMAKDGRKYSAFNVFLNFKCKVNSVIKEAKSIPVLLTGQDTASSNTPFSVNLGNVIFLNIEKGSVISDIEYYVSFEKVSISGNSTGSTKGNISISNFNLDSLNIINQESVSVNCTIYPNVKTSTLNPKKWEMKKSEQERFTVEYKDFDGTERLVTTIKGILNVDGEVQANISYAERAGSAEIANTANSANTANTANESLNSAKLNGKSSDFFYNKENANLPTVDWNAKNVVASGDIVAKKEGAVVFPANDISGGSQYLYELLDVEIQSPKNGDILVFNGESQMWCNYDEIVFDGGTYSTI